MVSTSSKAHPSLAEEQVPRTHKTTYGTSRNPEYNINKDSPRFKRSVTGKRLAPMSQLNSYSGRELAQGDTMKGRSTHRVSLQDKQEHNYVLQPEPSQARNFSRHWPSTALSSDSLSIPAKLSDRDLLPSQKPLINPSHAYTVSHDTSHELISSVFTPHGRPTVIRSPQQLGSQDNVLCPLCNQTPASLDPSTNFSHICSHCHRFVFHRPPPTHCKVTALQPNKPLPPIPQLPAQAPVPPRKNVPRQVRCKGCVAVPGGLQGDFEKVFDACVVCGNLGAQTVKELVAQRGVSNEWVTEELEKWLLSVVREMLPNLGGHGSGKSVTSSTGSEGGLRRKGAIRKGNSMASRKPFV